MPAGLKLSLERLLAVVVLVGGVGFSYFRFIEPRLDARRFPDLSRYAELTAPDELADSSNKPYRIGQVLLLYPARSGPAPAAGAASQRVQARIHPAWYRIARALRAHKPTEVGTVIHLLKREATPPSGIGPDGEPDDPGRPEGIELVVFDWHKRRPIGRQFIANDPEAGAVPTSVIAEAIDAMPARP